MLSHFDPIVIHSGSDLTRPLFAGYAFNDVDIIVGAHGFEEWTTSKNRRLNFHEDGCYVLARPTHSGYEIGADYKGYCKVFIYRHLREWAVSNSFSTLVEFAHLKGWPVTANEHVFLTHSFAGSFWQQSTTFETAVEEISLLPRTYTINVARDGTLSIAPSPPLDDVETSITYADALSDFQRLWVGRLGTAIRHTPNVLTAELTGGLDSRVILSLLLGLRQYFPTHYSKQLFMHSNPTQAEDLQVATRICKIYRLNLNTATPTGKYGMEAYDPVMRWWDMSLGSYTPIYFAPKSSTVGHFQVGGHGGEGHRAYWQMDSPHAKLKESEAAFLGTSTFREMSDSFDRTRDILDAQYPGVPKTVAHYREFRDRIHSGLHAQNTVRLQPLSSSASYRSTNLLPGEALERGQFLYDVIANSAPSLLRQPFDKPAKSPAEETLQNVTYANAMYPIRGSLFGADQRQLTPTPVSPNSWDRLRDAYNVALQSANNLPVPQRVTQDAEEAWQSVRRYGKLPHPKHSVSIQHVLLSGLIDGTVSRASL